MKTVKGNLVDMGLKGAFDMIVHGCNCFHTMGAGIAREIKTKIPKAYEEDCRTVYGSQKKLGHYSLCLSKGLIVINAYTQFGFGTRKDVDYTAIKRVFERLNIDCASRNLRIGIPAIGCGLAGGNWEVVRRIIEDATPNLDITFVEYEK